MNILFQGTVAYNGQDIAFSVAETEQKQLQISISFVRGSNTNQAKFEFNKVEENHWTLDRSKTNSEINLDLKYDNTNDRWIFGTDNLMGVGNIEMVLKKKQEELESEEKTSGTEYCLTIEKDGKELENLTEIECPTEESEIEIDPKYEIDEDRIEDKNNPVTVNREGNEIHLDLNRTIKAIAKNMGPVRKFFTLPVIKGLCNDLERTIEEQAAKQIALHDEPVAQIQGQTTTHEQEQTNSNIIKTITEHRLSHENQKNTFLQRIISNTEALQNRSQIQSI